MNSRPGVFGRQCALSQGSAERLRTNPGRALEQAPYQIALKGWRNARRNPSPAAPPNTTWTATQTYALAAVCLLIGVLVGYLVRRLGHSRGPVNTASAEMQPTATAQPSDPPPKPMPTLDDMKRMADKQAEPLLAKLKPDPKNLDLLNKITLTYKATHQFPEAISDAQKASVFREFLRGHELPRAMPAMSGIIASTSGKCRVPSKIAESYSP